MRLLALVLLGLALLRPLPAMATPERIVAAGGDLTEIVFALGAGDRLVGVDSTSTWPETATELPGIGYVRQLSAEGVLSLAPDLVLGAYDAGPVAALDQLRAAGVQVALAPEAVDVDGVVAKIRFVGEVLGLEAKAEELAATVRREMARIEEKVRALPERPKVLFVLSVQDGAPLVGGAGSSAAAIIELAGGENAAAAIDGYKAMSREAIIAAAPDVVLMMTSHADRLGGIDAVMQRPEFALTPAGKAGRAITMDGMLLLGFGPRTPKAVAQLAAALHPGAGR